MESRNKIDAFTLTEVLVVIVITAIVVSLALSVLNLVQQNFYSIRENFQATTNNQLLKQRLEIDFNRYHTIGYNEEAGQISFKNPLDSVFYKYEDSTLIREVDTIAKEIQDMSFYFNGMEVKQGQLDAVKIHLGNGRSVLIFVSKINSAANEFVE